jgi:hypothetical protein
VSIPSFLDSRANAKSPDVPGGVDIAIAIANVSPRVRRIINGVASVPFPDTARDLAAHFARVLLETSRPLKSEGAGNAGRPMRPQPRV